MTRWQIILLGSAACGLLVLFETRATAQAALPGAVRIEASRDKGPSLATGIVLKHRDKTYLVTAYHHLLNSNSAVISLPDDMLIIVGDREWFHTRTVGGVSGLTAYCDPVADIIVFRFNEQGEKKLAGLADLAKRQGRPNPAQPVSLPAGLGVLPTGSRLVAAGNLKLSDLGKGVKQYYNARNMSFSALAAHEDNITQIVELSANRLDRRVLDKIDSHRVLMVESLSIDKGFSGGPLVVGDGPNAGSLVGMVWGGTLTGTVKPGRFAWAATAQQIHQATDRYDNDSDIAFFLAYGKGRPLAFPDYPYSKDPVTSEVVFASGVIDVRGETFWDIDQPSVDRILAARGEQFHFTNVRFEGVDFSNGRLINARFYDCRFNNCKFAKANLNGCSFSDCFVDGKPMEVNSVDPLLCYGVVLQNGDAGYGSGLFDRQWDLALREYAAVAGFSSYLDALLPPTDPRSAAVRNLATAQRVELVSKELEAVTDLRKSSIGRQYADWSLQVALLSCDLALTHLLRGDRTAAEEFIRRTDLEMAKLDVDNFTSNENRMLRQLDALRKLVLLEQTRHVPTHAPVPPVPLCESLRQPIIIYNLPRCALPPCYRLRGLRR